MKFKLINDLIFIPIKVNYLNQVIELNALVDTGSATTAVDINFFILDYARPSAIRDLIGVGGKQRVIAQNVEQLIIGNIVLKDIILEFCDLDFSLGIQAFVGGDVLNGLNSKIDYSVEKLEFLIS